MAETYDIQKAIEAQKKHCSENKYPHFAPYDGVCWKCNRQIYKPALIKGVVKQGITVEKASRELITGCPHCNWSYCD